MSCNMHNDCNCNCLPECTVFNGNSVDIDINTHDCEIRADVVVSEYQAIRLWGRVLNCDGKPVANALIKLIKVDCNGYKGVAHTVSDCDGFYQFELYNCDKVYNYKLLVSKATYGSEKVVPIIFNDCAPCDGPDVCPSDSYTPQNSNFKYTENRQDHYNDKYNYREVNYAYGSPKYHPRNK